MSVIKPGARVEQIDSHRLAFVLFASNTSDELVVRFDDFAYNSVVGAHLFRVLPDEPFRRTVHNGELLVAALAEYQVTNPDGLSPQALAARIENYFAEATS